MGSDMILAAESGGSGAFNVLLLLAIPLVFYFLLIRPQSKRRKEQMQMQNDIQPGARVLTTSGMRATVVEIDDDGLLLEIADGVEVRFVKQAVMQVLKDDEPDELDDELEELDEDGDEQDDDAVDLSKDGAEVDLSKDGDARAEDTAADEDGEPASEPKGKTKVKAADKPSA
ncbi:preprotein translocase subunit YajC [Actinomadura sp. NAK00032]|uniref:preprotein translocase subunit YajC n=1 Tax=Actinomadura sp. NAK00032 TaxID=2742128 RepID=UPI001591CBE5|nr:preprotein translocase subunit YajC [Actinomadura sp. NAK00032]QKW35853.1 preprotein translocase subunit YajC [Actinomadura sp. NAK00032]